MGFNNCINNDFALNVPRRQVSGEFMERHDQWMITYLLVAFVAEGESCRRYTLNEIPNTVLWILGFKGA